MCHDFGIPVLVDGAHAAGQIELDIEAVGCDFYVGNCHKWLCGPRGSGFLWAAEEWHATLTPPVSSHGHGNGYLSEFIWDGARDYAALLAVLPPELILYLSLGA